MGIIFLVLMKKFKRDIEFNIEPSQFLNLVNKSNKRSNEEDVYGPISKRLRSANYQIADKPISPNDI